MRHASSDSAPSGPETSARQGCPLLRAARRLQHFLDETYAARAVHDAWIVGFQRAGDAALQARTNVGRDAEVHVGEGFNESFRVS